jgi:CubicO group peptidase (beta-lactamase class C family)
LLLGFIIEEVSGRSLDAYVADELIRPLEMSSTGYGPVQDKCHKVVAEEYTSDDRCCGRTQPVRGVVHDENCFSLGGVAGHAGLFSTAEDLSKLCKMLVNDGIYNQKTIIRSDTLRLALRNWNHKFPGHDHGLGFELNKPWYMGSLAAMGAYGHTGFTGTSIVVHNPSKSFAILLTNRVHPTRDWGQINVARAEIGDALAREIKRRGL